MRTFLFSLFAGFALFSPLAVGAVFIGETANFSIDEERDLLLRDAIVATLIKIGPEAYYYMETTVWNALSQVQQSDVVLAVDALDREFHSVMYPTLTSTFGSEWNPGIDNDSRITVLFHRMKGENGGYVNFGDEYEKVQYPNSNQREMVYLNTERLGTPIFKSFLAHEFVHLITFNQKERLRGITEDVWLNELRAEYAPTLLGYDAFYQDSNLKRRVQNFAASPQDSLTEWQNEPGDYGVANLLSQYIADHYGAKILVDSLHASTVGIASLQDALKSNGFEESFSQVFTNWVFALFLNDCKYGERYCYHNPLLKNLRLVPQTNFLPSTGESVLTLNNTTKDWAGNWIRVVGGKEVMTVEFQSAAAIPFTVPYFLERNDGSFAAKTLEVNAQNRGTITIQNFNTENRAIVLMPLAQGSVSPRQGVYPVYPYSLVISATEQTPEQKEAVIAQLLSKIDFLKKEIAKLQAQLTAPLAGPLPAPLTAPLALPLTAPLAFPLTTPLQNKQECQAPSQDLFFGMRESLEVLCLQEFLKNQGTAIYPEGLVTGNFFTYTHEAVIRFQEKYAQEILAPIGLTKGTGYVGSLTRQKMNRLF